MSDRFQEFKNLIIATVQAKASIRLKGCTVSRNNLKELVDLDEVFDLTLAGAPNEEIGEAFFNAFTAAMTEFALVLEEEAA